MSALPRGSILVLAALKEELAPLRQPLARFQSLRLVRTGIGPRKAAACACQHLPGSRLVISTGCCGGVIPAASSGTIIVPRRLLSLREGAVSEAPAPDDTWCRAACSIATQMEQRWIEGPLITVDQALVSPESKRTCHERTGAVAVDMETAAIAEVAAEHGIPLLCLRAVLDTVEEQLPDASALFHRGKLVLPKVASTLLTRPGTVLALAGLMFKLRTVMSSVARCLQVLLENEPEVMS